MKKLNLNPGSIVYYEDEKSKIINVLDMVSVMIYIFSKSIKKVVLISELKSFKIDEEDKQSAHLVEFTNAQLDEGKRRLEVIKPLLKRGRTKEKVEAVAKEEGVNLTTIYEWLKAYEKSGVTSSLIPRYDQRGGKGKTRVNAETELIISNVLKTLYLHKQKLTPKQVYLEIKKQCLRAELPAPHENTVRNRIDKLSDKSVLKMRESGRLAERLYANTDGKFPSGKYPLDVVQIDHTPIDLIVVDEIDRQPIGRPYLTLAIDVYSRMIVGFYISLEAPSYLSVSQCLSQLILKKDTVLLEYGVEGEWNTWGIPKVIHLDNAAEFRSIDLTRNCEQFGISIEWRPVARPQFGAHIERLIGTSMKEVHTLPGTTFSTITKRGEYKSDKEAIMTIAELENWYCEYIVNVYNKQVHSAINMTPTQKYEQGIFGEGDEVGRGIPEIIEDDYLKISFLPTEERTIQQVGVSIDKITYYHDILRRWIRAKNKDKTARKFIFKIDPRDISSIWFFDPELKQFFSIPYRNVTYPAISRRDLLRAKRYLAEKNDDGYDEVTIFAAYDAMQKIKEGSEKKTKTIRKENEIAHMNNRKLKARPAKDNIESAREDVSDELFKNIQPFDDIEVGTK